MSSGSKSLGAVVALSLVFFLSASGPRARAGEAAITGYEICVSAAPGNTFYVAGDPVYISAIIKTNGQPFEYERAFRAFLKQKYGFTGYVGCSISFTADGGTATFNGEVKQAGHKLVRTGWNPLRATPAPSAPKVYWICTLTTGDDTSYLSDVFAAADRANADTDMADSFGRFAVAKYGVKAPFHGLPACLDYGSVSPQRAQDALKAFTSHGGKHVLTHWSYGQETS